MKKWVVALAMQVRCEEMGGGCQVRCEKMGCG